MDIKNKKIGRDHFEEMREEILKQWPTGEDVNLEEAFEYHRQVPAHKIFSKKLSEAKKNKETLIQPRAGVALPDKHIELLTYLQDEGEADLLPTTVDSYTRQNRYTDAAKGIEESKKLKRSLLNGFPIVNYGVEICRQLNEAVNLPVQVRHGTPDARLLTEISLAGGFTSYEGGGISYNIPYAKSVSLERTIADWQYADRLVGIYEEAGISINREPFGPLTGTLVPPCISHTVAVVEALLAAEQGVKNITVGYGQCGNLIQDIAAIHALEELTEEYLKEYGYEDVEVTTVFHQWMGGFPADEAKAFGTISWGAAAAVLAGATKVITKTSHEAMGIPTKEANAAGLKTTKQLTRMLKDQRFIGVNEVTVEKEIIKEETRAIMAKLFELGEGDIAVGSVRGFEAGAIDIPFSPSRYNPNKIMPARDNQGAVRFLNTGNLPFNSEIKAFHEKKIEERAKYENRKPSFQMVIDDIYAISKGQLVGRPKN